MYKLTLLPRALWLNWLAPPNVLNRDTSRVQIPHPIVLIELSTHTKKKKKTRLLSPKNIGHVLQIYPDHH